MIQRNIFHILLIAFVAVVIATGVFAFQIVKDKKGKPAVQTTVKSDNAPADSAPTTPASNTNQSVPQAGENKATLVSPMDNFDGRITLNPFGNQPSQMQVDESQYTDLICAQGKNYPGYHTAVDLEVTPAERGIAVPVYSIADGTVRQAGFMNGYGGLIVIEYTINGQIYTAYYGHTNISTFTVKTGDKVKAGQKLAELAPACTDGNGQTRKHLHFGMHKGKDVVAAGYVDTKKELNSWIDPREIVK